MLFVQEMPAMVTRAVALGSTETAPPRDAVNH
jgi:hypothetical protein